MNNQTDTHENYLLDTNVLSALRKPQKEPKVAAWAISVPVTHLYTAAPVIAEIGLGIAALERRDKKSAQILHRWFENKVLRVFSERILPFGTAEALEISTFRVPDHAPYDDALIAAIAKTHNMTVVTRNTKHFESLDVPLINPWKQRTNRTL